MRKMMLVAAVLLAAAVTQAASVGWSLAGANNYVNKAYQFFVIGQKGATDVSTITALLDAGSDTSSYAFGSGTIASNGAATVPYTTAGQPTLGAGTYTAFFVIFDAATPTAAANYAVVQGAANLTKTVSATAAGVAFAAGAQGDFLNNANNWHATPEPTSVALLLLGAAAFGLKRKRA